MTSERLLPIGALVLLALAGFTWFPGHTWLQSDTQIYTPILEHLADPGLLARDPIAIHAHVTWTIYDEVNLALHRAAGLDWGEMLAFQQIVFRSLGLLGCFLFVHSFSGGIRPALFAAACFGLGAVVDGPAVLTIEYEPVPRTFAVMLLLLAFGLGAQGRWAWSTAAATLATLYHPTTTAPFWLSLLFVALREPLLRRRAAIDAAVAAGFLFLVAFLAPGAREPQPWFGRIDDALAQVQRLRGAYNWVELWPPAWLAQYFILFAVVLLAWRRLRDHLSPLVSRWILALSVCAIASVPLQWLLLDRLRWILIPQFQPARAVLFLTALTVLMGAACGWRAAASGRWAESIAWLAVVYALPANGLLVTSAWPVQRLMLVLALAAGACLTAIYCTRRPGALSSVAFALTLAAPFFLIPKLGAVRNYRTLHTPELDQLCAWASTSSPRDSVFLFPDVHRRLEPGVFRAKARRALYVDWKGGGQVNIMPRLGLEWWRRWSAVGQARQTQTPISRYRELGIDYLVVQAGKRPPDTIPLFANSAWEVLPVQP